MEAGLSNCVEVSECLTKTSSGEVGMKNIDKWSLKQPAKDSENNLNSHELRNHNDHTLYFSEGDLPERKRLKLSEEFLKHEPVILNDIEKQEMPLTEQLRRQYKHDRQLALVQTKMAYHEHLTELFFLQNGGNLVDYYEWKKRPNEILASYLRSKDCDSAVCDGNISSALDGSVCVNGDDSAGFESTPRNASTPFSRRRDDDDSIDQDLPSRLSNLSALNFDPDVQNQNDSVSPTSSSTLTADALNDSKRFSTPSNTNNNSGYVASGYDSFTNSYAASYEGGGGGGNQETIAELAKQEAEVKHVLF